MGDENAPARAFDVSGWCHERDRRWATYGAQAAHDPWPQTHVFLRDDESCSLWVAARGSGGGSRQATFRNELEERLEAGWRACRRAGWHREPTHALREFEGAVQQAFLSATEPSFAHHFGATWAAALTRGRRCALVSLGACRGFLVRGGLATQLTTDRTLYTASHAAGPPQLYRKDISLAALGAYHARSPDAELAESKRLFERALTLTNRGADTLTLHGALVADPRVTVQVSRDSVPSGETAILTLSWEGGESLESTLCIASNDPDGPTQTLTLTAGAVGDYLGQAAPDFALQTLDGDTLRLSEQLGYPVLLVYFATW